LLAKHCFASARTHSRQRLGRTAERGLRRVLHGHALRLPRIRKALLWLWLWLWASKSGPAGRRPAG